MDVSVRSTGTELINEGLPSPIFSLVNPVLTVLEIKIPQFRTIFRREGLGAFHEQAVLAPGRYLVDVGISAAAETARPGTTLRAHGESVFTIDFSPAQTPEPTSIALLGSGVLGLLGIRRQNRTRRT